VSKRQARISFTILMISYWIATGIGFYIVSDHNWFDATFGVFAVAVAASVIALPLLVVVRLWGDKNRT
jgi:hypothetical protein